MRHVKGQTPKATDCIQAYESDPLPLLPFPKFLTRPSATTLYCRSVQSNSLWGQNEYTFEGKKSPAGIFASIDQSQSDKLKLNFVGKDVLVSLGDGPSFPYKVLNDAPTDFFAILDRTKEVAMLQTLAINREEGTMIFTQIYANLRGLGPPNTMSQFYVCSPTPDWKAT